MISSEVQRTLVKSPPELWAELSDPAALARHLGELGEIRIVRTEPESTVEWVSENTTGVVSIKPSGWGTKVTLSVTRQLTEPEPAESASADTNAELVAFSESSLEGEPESSSESSAETGWESSSESSAETRSESSSASTAETRSGSSPEEPHDHLDAGPEGTASADVDTVEPPATSEGETPATSHREAAVEAMPASEPKPRRGFFARLFSRRRPPAPAAEQVQPVSSGAPAASDEPVAAAAEQTTDEPDAFAAVTQALAPESIAETHPFAAPVSAPAPAAPASVVPAPTVPAPTKSVGISAELMAAEEVTAAEVTAEEVTAVLTAVLDRLGAAHHRPFSRA